MIKALHNSNNLNKHVKDKQPFYLISMCMVKDKFEHTTVVI